jgi:Zn-dependent protease
MNFERLFLTLPILLFSAIVHEVSHGLMAEKLGDDTAREEGRITLNPIPHIDPFGSILLPAVLLLVQSPIIFGSAKPVPVNFANLRNPRLGMALVSLAGPAANFFLAFVLVIPYKLGISNDIVEYAIFLNILLGTFNLIPIPPLDGSKILASFGSHQFMYRILSLERYGFMLVFIFLLLGWLDKILLPVIFVFSKLFGIDFF